LSITFSDGRDIDILLAAAQAVRAGIRVVGCRGVRMRRLLVGLVLAAPAPVVVAIRVAR